MGKNGKEQRNYSRESKAEAAAAGKRKKEESRLMKEARALRKENESLKKRLNFSLSHLRVGRPTVTVYRFIREYQNQWTIRTMAKVFGVTGSSYYKWAKKGEL
jgi:regulator of replication initiation timing